MIGWLAGIVFWGMFGTAYALSYSTSFTGTENPISESNHWINGGTTGIDFTNVRKTPGLAFGTQPGNLSPPQAYADSTAVLTGTWGANQQAQGVAVDNSTSGAFQEIELRIHTTITANSITGYECLFSVRPLAEVGYSVQIVRWNGGLAQFTLLDNTGTAPGGDIKTGDVLLCKNVGNTITAWVNGTLVVTNTDSTYTGAGQGSPGIGFFLQNATGRNAQYGFSSFTATDGLTTRSSGLANSSHVSGKVNLR